MDDGFDGVFANPVLELRTGTQPADADSASVGDLLCVVTMPVTGYFAAAADKQKGLAGSWSGTVSVGGTPTWFRIKNTADIGGASTTLPRIDGSVSDTLGDLVMDLPLVSSDDVSISTFYISIEQAFLGLSGTGTLL